MKYFVEFTVVVACLVFYLKEEGVEATPSEVESEIPVAALSKEPVRGKLGARRGTMMRIQCRLMESPRDKTSKFIAPYHIAVTQVDGRRLERPMPIDFTISSESLKRLPLRRSDEEFALAVADGMPQRLSAGAKVARAWLGRTIECLAYESGAYRGAPRSGRARVPNSIAGRASRGFHFHSHVVLVAP